MSKSKQAMKWRKPRVCTQCGHVHRQPEEAKCNVFGGVYCTWCGDRAPPLKVTHVT